MRESDHGSFLLLLQIMIDIFSFAFQHQTLKGSKVPYGTLSQEHYWDCVKLKNFDHGVVEAHLFSYWYRFSFSPYEHFSYLVRLPMNIEVVLARK
ncbi:MAG: hypothetical protein OXC63_07815 [Aestuariivita sp.]|nr:hypothetical protein [Aestuariivita sp.]MCY4288482.1 hypothetical protein [Aestuariivita sp.]MCY4347066.1 hypothetical protein [Aestuariivita sp.]